MISLSEKSFYMLLFNRVLVKKTFAGFVTSSAALKGSYGSRTRMQCSESYFLFSFFFLSGYL